jgi:hypothetical protein
MLWKNEEIRWRQEFRDHYLDAGGGMNSRVITSKWEKGRRKSSDEKNSDCLYEDTDKLLRAKCVPAICRIVIESISFREERRIILVGSFVVISSWSLNGPT